MQQNPKELYSSSQKPHNFQYSGLESITQASHIQVKLNNFESTTITMVQLSFSQDESSAAMKAEELKQANVDKTTTVLYFENFCFDEDIVVRAVIDLFHRAFQKGLQLKCLDIDGCTGRVDEILHVASALHMFDKISLVAGPDSYELSNHGFWSISAAMKFKLTKLHLESIEMTKQQAATLGTGLITSSSPHFKKLKMSDMTFEDGAITELASGLKQNSSLCILSVAYCNLGDAELAVLIDAVESHPLLKKLSLYWNGGQEHALVALGKVLASRSCRIEELDFSDQGTHDSDHDGLTGRLGILAQGLRWNDSLTRLDLSSCKLLDEDIDDLEQILATCKLEELNLSDNEITHSGIVSLTQNIPKSLKALYFAMNGFGREEAACHTLTLLEEHPQLWYDGFDWNDSKWNDSKLPIHKKIQHFKDLNRCGRILLARSGAIPLAVWPIVLARANTLLSFPKERTPNAIFHLLQGPALMQRRFDRESSQAACIGVGVSHERLTTSSKGPAETIDKESAKKGRS
jgi:hypothetical protein